MKYVREEAAERRVLLVEDDEVTRDSLARLLRQDGWEVVTAVDGVDGLARMLGDRGIAVIVTDVMMPRLDGLEMLERMRRIECRTCPAVIVSAVDVPAEALQQGDSYLRKPIDLALLEHTLEDKVCARQR